MIWFIPSWYQDESIIVKEMNWNRTASSSRFDDTVSQVKIFKEEDKEVSLMILSYSPHLRHFLYREEIMDVDYTSVFDDLQDIQSKRIGLYSYKDLNWPSDVEWIYTPYIVLAKRNGALFAKIYFGKEGYMIGVDLFQNERKRLIFDDRGFLSCVQYYKEDNLQYEEYYNERGEWQFRHEFNSGEVVINETQKHRFRKLRYESIEEMMKEYLQKKLYYYSFDDYVVIAADEHHNDLIMKSIWKQKVILSLFGNRFDIVKGEYLYHRVDVIITDSNDKKNLIEDSYKVNNVYTISPLDTRFKLGQSQRTKRLKIYFILDDTSFSYLEEIMKYMISHPLVDLYIGLYHFEDYYDGIIQDKINQMLSQLEAPFKIDERVFLKIISDERDLITLLSDIRIIVDVRETSDSYTQIAGMSTGIPQIVKQESNYVYHKKNGFCLDHGYSVAEGLYFYLEDLDHWNDSLVYSYHLMQEYSGKKIMKKWREIIDNASKY